MKKLCIFTAGILPFILIYSCQNTDLKRGLSIAKEIQKRQCDIDSIVLMNRTEWQVAMTHFEKSLPADLPEKERTTMLTLTNGELIRMFNSYDQLADSTKAIIDTMETKDKSYAASIKDLREEIDLLKSELTDYLEVSTPDELLLNRINEILTKKCN